MLQHVVKLWTRNAAAFDSARFVEHLKHTLPAHALPLLGQPVYNGMCACARACICLCMCMCMCMCIFMCICMFVCMCVRCVRVFVAMFSLYI